MAKKQKTVCPVSRDEFMAHAPVMKIMVGNREYNAKPREFSTGSLGWYVNDKMEFEVAGKTITIQLGLNLTVVGSKDLPPNPGAAAPPSEAAPAVE